MLPPDCVRLVDSSSSQVFCLILYSSTEFSSLDAIDAYVCGVRVFVFSFPLFLASYLMNRKECIAGSFRYGQQLEQ